MTVLESLNSEWLTLGQTPVDWTDSPALAECQVAEDALTQTADRGDEVLGYLIERLQRDGDDLAGRTVLQSMLGKLVRLALGRPESQELLTDLIAQMWIRIATYPLQRRPCSVAANLWMDSRKHAMQLREGRDVPVDALPDSAIDDEPSVEADTGAGFVREALRRGLIDDLTAQTMLSVHGADEPSSAEVGDRLGMSPANVRTRCLVARRRIVPMAKHLLAMELAA